MKTFRPSSLPVFCLVALVFWAGNAGAYELRVVNTSAYELESYPVVVRLEKMPEAYRTGRLKVVGPEGELVSQLDDLDRDGVPDELVFMADLEPKSSLGVRVERGRSARFWSDVGTADNYSLFRNSFIECEAVTDYDLGLTVRDAETGEGRYELFLIRQFQRDGNEALAELAYARRLGLEDGQTKELLEALEGAAGSFGAQLKRLEDAAHAQTKFRSFGRGVRGMGQIQSRARQQLKEL